MCSETIYPRNHRLYSGPRVRDTETFITKARYIWGDTYDYSMVEYKSAHEKVKIICPNGFITSQSPCRHLGGRRPIDQPEMTWEQWVYDANQAHDDKYSYTPPPEINKTVKVEAYCPIHQLTFYVEYYRHVARGQKCLYCASEESAQSRKLTQEEFVSMAKARHGDSYDYSESIYTATRDYINIRCKAHDYVFRTKANNHLRGIGRCTICYPRGGFGLERIHNLNPNSPCVFYWVRIHSGDRSFQKIGITTISVKRRLSALITHGFGYEVLDEVATTCINASLCEREIIDNLIEKGQYCKVHDLKNTITKGWTECFKENALDPSPYVEKLKSCPDDREYDYVTLRPIASHAG